MTKGEAYRLYYEANKEEILKANKERAKQEKELRRVSPEDDRIYREKRKKRDEKRKALHYKVTLEELSERNKVFSLFYKKISESSLISEMTPSILSFLMRIHYETLEENKVDGDSNGNKTKSD